MFLELHLEENDSKIMLNIDKIKSIYQERKGVSIYIGEIVYRVKESYEDIAKCIDKYYEYRK
jgi:hypothetical protein